MTQLLAAGDGADVGVFEPSAYRRDSARRLGADHAWLPGDATSMASFDVVFECSGTVAGFQAATRIVRAAGTVVLVGFASESLPVEPFVLIGRELRLQGSIIYDDTDFNEAISLLSSGTIDVDALTTDIVPLEDFADAFRRLRNPELALKILLRP